MAAFELCLPEMVMGVNKARANDLATAVDKLSARWSGNALADLGDLIGLDQDISIP